MAGLARFNMELTPAGVGSKIEVNGEDVTAGLRGVTVSMGANEVTRVTLHAMAHRDNTKIKGEGVVYVQAPAEGSVLPGEAARVFLEDIDPRQLEKAMLDALGEMDGGKTTGEIALEVLKKWAAGE